MGDVTAAGDTTFSAGGTTGLLVATTGTAT